MTSTIRTISQFSSSGRRRPRPVRANHRIRSKAARGFTLIELVTVMVILGILSTFALPAYLDYGADARKAADEASIAAIRTGLHMAYAKHRIDDAPGTQWVLLVSDIQKVMQGGALPDGIQIVPGQQTLSDRSGNTYPFTAETATTPAQLSIVPGGGGGS